MAGSAIWAHFCPCYVLKADGAGLEGAPMEKSTALHLQSETYFLFEKAATFSQLN